VAVTNELQAIPDAVRISELTRSYAGRPTSLVALDSITLTIAAGESVAVVGPSGSGKTTLLNLLSGLDRPTSGYIEILGHKLNRMSEGALTTFRSRNVGLVFQESYLLAGLTALENVMVGRLPKMPRRRLEAEARACLEAVGLGSRSSASPSQLSGGERQRVGIARALVGRPSLVVADEPTGNLDEHNTSNLLALLQAARVTYEYTLVLATHNIRVAESMGRVIELREGRLASLSVVS
jgi:ABC-type lipoprotein export system ATPase subunit